MAEAQFGEWPLLDHKSKVNSCAYSQDGKTFAVGLHNGSLYGTANWEKTHTLDDHTIEVHSVVFSSSGRQITSGGRDNMVRLWDAQTGTPGAVLSGHTDEVTSVVFSPSGQLIASGS